MDNSLEYNNGCCNNFKLNNSQTPLSYSNLLSTAKVPIADSGATHTLIRQSDATNLTHVEHILHPLTVTLPNGTTISSTARGQIPTNNVINPIDAHIFPDSQLDQSLISLSDYTNRGCEVVLTAHGITITKDGQLLAHNHKQPTDRLWHIPVLHEHASSHHVIRHELTAERVQFYHAAFGSPPVATFLHAIHRNYIRGIPDLTTKAVRANPPHSISTALGHLNLQRQGIRSTHSAPAPSPTHHIIINEPDLFISDPIQYNTFYSDATGRMPHPSRHGHQYLLISVHNNFIHAEPLLSRTAANYIKAFENILKFFKGTLHRIPTCHIMDNETSAPVEDFFRNNNITVQRVPPHDHRANRAESAIRDFKNHFISILALCPSSMDSGLWDDWLPQCELTLNTLRPCGTDPSISAYHGIYGSAMDFDAHPIAPIGTKVIVHEPPSIRSSWSEHGQHAFYLGPDLNCYRTWKVYVPASNRIRSSNSLAWFPFPYVIPGASNAEFILRAINDLTMAVHALTPHLPADRTPLVSTVNQLRDQLASFYPTPLPPLPPIAQLTGSDLPYQYQYIPPIPAGDQRVEDQRVEDQRVNNQTVNDQRVDNQNVDSQRVIIDPANNHHLDIQNVDNQSVIIDPASNPHFDLPLSTTSPTDINAPTVASTVAPNINDSDHSIPLGPPPGLPHPPRPSSRTLNLTEDGRPLTYQRAKSGPDHLQWSQAEATELRKLIKDYNCMKPIHNFEQPLHRRKDTSYYNPQVKEKKLKDGSIEHRVRGTYGGNIQSYSLPLSAHVAEMEVVKTLLISIASDRANNKYAKFAHFDIKDFYLAAPLPQPEYIRLTKHQLPTEIINEFNLHQYQDNKGAVLFEINKSLYGLRQAGRVSQERLLNHLSQHDYYQDDNVPCLFHHKTRNIHFTLVVDDFGIKYFRKQDVDHLHTVLTKLYPVKVDYNATEYLGFKINFNDAKRTVTLSMPGYVSKLLERHADIIPQRARSTPEDYQPVNYGNPDNQKDPLPENSPLLTAKDIKRLQSIIGSLLYYARAVDPTILHAVNHAASLQSHPTAAVFDRAKRILQYLKMHPNHRLTYQACDMILYGMSDASYLSRSGSRSVAGGFTYLGNRTSPTTIINPPIVAISSILPTVAASVAEAEYGSAFLLAQQALWIRTILNALGYAQPITTILCDNQCATNIAMRDTKLRRAKSISMRYHWLRDQVALKNFKLIWIKSEDNIADIFTKALPKARFISLAQKLVTEPRLPTQSYLSSNINRGIQFLSTKIN